MGRRAARTDANQSEIVETLRRAGASVQSLATIGRGVPDLLIGFRGRNYLAEVKDGGKRLSARKLTDDEARWLAGWMGQVAVIETALDALALIGRARPGDCDLRGGSRIRLIEWWDECDGCEKATETTKCNRTGRFAG